jgi:predicted TIM-barrel fold metal-dependent hydrolase
MHKIIDPHLHLFNLQQGDYAWLKAGNPPAWPNKQILNRDFTEADLTLNPELSLAGFVHIEAGFDNLQPWLEIDWLEQHCALPFKSVAFVDMTASTFAQHIKQVTKRNSVVGIRHILDEQAAVLLSSTVIHSQFALLAQYNLSFDAQLSLADRQAIELLTALAAAYPQVKIIINHGGYVLNCHTPQEQNDWLKSLQKIANQPNLALKLSGWEMSDRHWQPEQVSRVLQDGLDTLGESRVMLASNFPVCLLSKSYAQLWSTYAALPNISEQCFEKLSCRNAMYWYQF